MTVRESLCKRELKNDTQMGWKVREKKGRKFMTRRGVGRVEDRRMEGRRHGGQFFHISH